MKTSLITALLLTLTTTFAHASSGQWNREVVALVAEQAKLTELDYAAITAHICGAPDTYYLLSEPATGEIFGLGVQNIPSMENENTTVNLLNIRTCQTKPVKI